jgi:hypothetical protein
MPKKVGSSMNKQSYTRSELIDCLAKALTDSELVQIYNKYIANEEAGTYKIFYEHGKFKEEQYGY